MNSTLAQQIAETEAVVNPLIAKLDSLRRQQREQTSKAFISEHRIKRSDVEMSDGDGKPWFGTAYEFGRWMRTHGCTKQWAEWNGRLYYAAELMLERMRDTPAGANHLPSEASSVPSGNEEQPVALGKQDSGLRGGAR